MSLIVNDEDAEKLAREYLANKTPELFDRVIEANLDFVRGTVSKMNLIVPQGWEVADLVQFGNIGLIESISRYDPSKSKTATFRLFSHWRVRGSVLDALQKFSQSNRVKNTYVVSLEYDTAYKEVADYESDDAFNSIDHFLSVEASARVRSSLQEMPIKHSLTFLLLMHGFKPKHIASVYDCSLVTVYKYRDRAQSALRDNLIEAVGESTISL